MDRAGQHSKRSNVKFLEVVLVGKESAKFVTKEKQWLTLVENHYETPGLVSTERKQ